MRPRWFGPPLVLLCWTVFGALAPLHSEEPAPGVVIARITADIEGNTRPYFLLNELRIREGQEFESLDDLNRRLDSRVAVLLRRRLFKEFSWEVVPISGAAAEVRLRVVDSFTLYPRPMVEYSSSSGLQLGLKLQYYNAFGTLTDQEIESYWSPEGARIRLDNRNIALASLHFDLYYDQFDGMSRFGDPEGNVVLEYRYTHSLFGILATWPLGPTGLWSYRFEPRLLWQYNYRSIYGRPDISADRFIDDGFAPEFSHGILTDRVTWEGNFRRGMGFSLTNGYTWHLGTNRGNILLESDLFGYRPVLSWLEISGRLGGFYAVQGFRRNAGDRLRGVVDYMTYGKWGAFLTAQANFAIGPPGGFLEPQFRPFVDIGYVQSEDWPHGGDSWEYCAGATFIMFVRALPSLTLNIEWGWDFKRNSPEIIIDTTLLL